MDIATPNEIVTKLLLHIRSEYRFQSRAAEAWGVKKQYLSAILHQHQSPSNKVLKEIGFERVVVYRRIEK